MSAITTDEKLEDNSCDKEEEHIIASCTNDNDMKKMHTCAEELDVCACCGKEGSNLNVCNKCKAVKYCNLSCKKKHRSKHKKQCERHVAELHDEQLFKRPPQKEDCPICFLPLPSLPTGTRYKDCCGKTICSGCIYAVQMRKTCEGFCPFCRVPRPNTNKEIIKMHKKRAEAGDSTAIYGLGRFYYNGQYGLQQSYSKALELWHQAAELGYAAAFHSIGIAYHFGEGVERDNEKTKHYVELAAMGGVVTARHFLGVIEYQVGNQERALKHWLIAAGDGHNESVDKIRKMYMNRKATKDDYTNALIAYQECINEIKSEQREKAAAVDVDCKYY